MDYATGMPPYVAKPLRLRPFSAAMLAPGRVGDRASARTLARPYRDGTRRLGTWIERGWASEESSDALFLHEYTSGGLTVRGLVGALDMSSRAADLAERAVWPHEEVHPEQAGDLATRMESLRLNPAPILLVHEGVPAVREVVSALAATPPDRSFVDRAEQKHRVWALRDPSQLQRVEAALAHSDCLIADGHHRYAAYLALQEQHPGTEWDLGLAMLVDQTDTPLHLGPIHRSLAGTSLDALHDATVRLGAHVSMHARSEALNALASDTVVVTDGSRWCSIRASLESDRAIVEWLHDDVIPTLDPAPQISYHHDVNDTLTSAGMDQIGVLMPSLTFGHVRAIVASGRLLPEKATSFQPKPSLGVLMRPVDDE